MHFSWILHGYSKNFREDLEEGILSPIFNFGEYQLQIEAHPIGGEIIGNLSIVIYYKSKVKHAKFGYLVVCAKNSDDEILREIAEKSTFNEEMNFKFQKFLEHSDLKSLNDDVLKIYVTMFVDGYSPYDVHYSSGNSIHENVKVALRNKLFTDFIIKIKEYELPVHKVVLIANSEFFRELYENDILEKYFEMNDISKETLDFLDDFMYKDEIKKLSCEDAEKLLYAANTYKFLGVKDVCENVLMGKLNSTNALNILLLADIYDGQSLKAFAINYITKHHWKFFDDNTKLQKIVEKLPKFLLTEVLSDVSTLLPRKTATTEKFLLT